MSSASQRPLIVMKFGGSSLATAELVQEVARHARQVRDGGHRVVVVVSAMGGETDRLRDLYQRVAPHISQLCLDHVGSSGERASSGLVAGAIASQDHEAQGARQGTISEAELTAIPLTGAMAGLITSREHGNARVLKVNPTRLKTELARGRIAVVAGYQGMSDLALGDSSITTLGRGGTDTTAVVLGAVLGAERVEIYSDTVVKNGHPRFCEAQVVPALSYRDMLRLTSAGVGVLARPSVQVAMAENVTIVCRKTGDRTGLQTVVAAEVAHSPAVLAVAVTTTVTRLSGSADAVRSARQALAGLHAAVLHQWRDEQRAEVWIDRVEMPAEASSHLEGLPGVQADHGGVVSVVLGQDLTDEVESTFVDTLDALGTGARRTFCHRDALSVFLPGDQLETVARALHRAYRLDEPQDQSVLGSRAEP